MPILEGWKGKVKTDFCCPVGLSLKLRVTLSVKWSKGLSCSLTIKPIHTEEGGWDYGEFKLLGSMGYDTLSDWVEGTASYL